MEERYGYGQAKLWVRDKRKGKKWLGDHSYEYFRRAEWLESERNGQETNREKVWFGVKSLDL